MKYYPLFFVVASLFTSTILCAAMADSAALKQLNLAEKQQYEQYPFADSISRLLLAEVKHEESQLSPSTRIEILYTTGKIYLNQGEYKLADSILLKAVELAHQNRDTLMQVKALNRLASCHLDMINQEDAVAFGLQALNLAEASNSARLMAIANGSLAETYRHIDNLSKAEEYNLLAIQHYKAIENWNELARSYNNFSATIGEAGRNQEAIDTLKVALNFVAQDDYFPRGKHYANIAFCFRNMGQYDSAIFYNRIALNKKKLAKDYYGMGYTLGSMGRSFMGLGINDSAVYYTKRALDTALKYRNLYRIRDSYKHLSEAYEAAGSFQDAYYAFDQFFALDDSIYREEVTNTVATLQRKYDLAKKEKEIDALKSDQEIAKANQQTILAILIGGIVFLLVLVLAFRYRAKQKELEKRSMALELERSQLEIEQHQTALLNYTQELMEKNKSLKSAQTQLIEKEQELETLRNTKSQELEKLSELKILTDEDWKKFKVLFDRVHPNFFNKLNQHSSSFTKGEMRLMALTRLNMTHSEVADTLGISTESVTKSRFRLKKKLAENQINSIETFVHQL